MSEELMCSKLKELAAQASVEKVRFVNKKDFEAAARWRDIEKSLYQTVKLFISIPRSKIEINDAGNDGDWVE
jgi:hypothetical protein